MEINILQIAVVSFIVAIILFICYLFKKDKTLLKIASIVLFIVIALSLVVLFKDVEYLPQYKVIISS